MVDFGQVDVSELVVYDAGVEIVNAPAVVINPSDPYQSVITMEQKGIQVNLELFLITNRTEPAAAFTYLEDLKHVVAVALRSMNPGFRWITFGGFGATEVGGQVYATAMMEITTIMRERE